MGASTDVAIIGAGPYGLSIAAHLRAQGVDHRIFGEPMQMWRDNMPPGMCLKSDGRSSDLSAPNGGFALRQYSQASGLDHHPTLLPVRLDKFVSYGLAFQQRYVPGAERKYLTRLERSGEIFALEFDDGDRVTANRVVIAVGVMPFKHIPENLAHLPAELASHSSAFGPIDHLDGRDVVIVGAGSSALDLAGLLYERGTNVTVITRGQQLSFHGRPPAQARSMLWKLRAPDSKIGAGWLHYLCDEAPELINMLPEPVRYHLFTTMLGPSAGYFIKDKVVGKVAVRYASTVSGASVHGGRIHVETQSREGNSTVVQGDHLIMATGFKLDAQRLAFLSADIHRRLRTAHNAPVLNRNFECSEQGLYFVGFASAPSFGPVMRFVAGAAHPAHRLARHLARRYRPGLGVPLADAVG